MMKKIMTMLGVSGSSALALAQESTVTAADFTKAKEAAQSISSGLVQLVTDVTPFVINVLLAVLAVTAIFVIVRWVWTAFRRR